MRHIKYTCDRCGEQNPEFVYFGTLLGYLREYVYKDPRLSANAKKEDIKEFNTAHWSEGCSSCMRDSFLADCNKLVEETSKRMKDDNEVGLKKNEIAVSVLEDAYACNSVNENAKRSAGETLPYDKIVVRPCRECGGNGDVVIYGQLYGLSHEQSYGARDPEEPMRFNFSFCSLCKEKVADLFPKTARTFFQFVSKKKELKDAEQN